MKLRHARDLTKSLLDSRLLYDPETGRFSHLTAPNKRSKDGYAGCLNAEGYRVISLFGHTHRAHRLAWLATYGEWPKQIDHVNGVRDDNRISNLRVSDPSSNMWNSKTQSNNSHGFKGVSHVPGTSRWQARIGVLNQRINLGNYDTPEEAAAAYRAAAIKYHGDFARFD